MNIFSNSVFVNRGLYDTNAVEMGRKEKKKEQTSLRSFDCSKIRFFRSFHVVHYEQ
jgi:hypothetical protein